MDSKEKDKLLLDLLNKFAKHEPNLQELVEFGVMFIINAAILSHFPASMARVIIEETTSLLEENLKIALKEFENDD